MILERPESPDIGIARLKLLAATRVQGCKRTFSVAQAGQAKPALPPVWRDLYQVHGNKKSVPALKCGACGERASRTPALRKSWSVCRRRFVAMRRAKSARPARRRAARTMERALPNTAISIIGTAPTSRDRLARARGGGYPGSVEENMTLCVEAYIGELGSRHGIKLEQQVWITADGAVPLNRYPFEEALL